MQDASSLLHTICQMKLFTYGVELRRWSRYGELDIYSLIVVAGVTLAFLTLAIISFDPQRGMKSGGKPVPKA